ncbi:MAG: histidine kinase [Gemmatimonadaceae bacterium]
MPLPRWHSPSLLFYAIAAYGTVVAVTASATILHESTYATAVRAGAFTWSDAYAWMLVRYGSWLALVPVVHAVVRRQAALSTLSTLSGFAPLTALAIAAVSVHRVVDVLARGAFAPEAPPSLLQGLRSSAIRDGPIDLLIYFGLLGSLVAFEAQRRVHASTEREAVAARSVEALRYEVLRAKVEPHFLFNALQSIATLIPRQPQRASALVLDLSEVLRAALQSGDTTRHSLGDEMTIVRAYLAIEEARFGERLHSTMDVADDHARVSVPALVLQPLVENAVRHGVSPKHEGGTIEVCSWSEHEQLCLQVRDDGVGTPEQLHEGIGLAAVRSRLATLYGPDASLTLVRRDGWTVAELRLPILHTS